MKKIISILIIATVSLTNVSAQQDTPCEKEYFKEKKGE